MTIKHRKSKRKMGLKATIQLEVKVMEEQAERITGENMVVRARQTRRHLSVKSLTAELQKVPYLSKKRGNFLGLKKKKKNEWKLQYHSGVMAGKLQTQVDDLLEKVTEKSIDLLAQKHAELQQCEFLGEEIFQSSKHFQLASKRTMRLYKLKHMHFPCTCCC
ncbi:LOW QUALITY PROTEIN: putative uncharacterized protein C3orf49 homolog [Mauremys reevesii]|uniref:LOW QUALITY PROTEIN: putative uncharacterized protein C3orf49 homolog n=1 Tax=Mauremys reevesii TaxID=260615 RepID=UPI00193FCE52|nr:LOW QUALITY PROTEIN: putative uncharacterized protein C3orf49 homolog [Mauremys reevesii]